MRSINHYDYLKVFALIIMIIDHIGAFYFPDLLWFRAVGRVGFPVWFFLFGYFYTGKSSFVLYLLSGLIALISFINNHSILPLDALLSFAISIELVKRYGYKFWFPYVCALFYPLSALGFAYGSLATLFVWAGWFHRNVQNISVVPSVIISLSFSIWQILCLPYDFYQSSFILVITALVVISLTLPLINVNNLNAKLTNIVLSLSSNTIYWYYLHLTLFIFTAGKVWQSL